MFIVVIGLNYYINETEQTDVSILCLLSLFCKENYMYFLSLFLKDSTICFYKRKMKIEKCSNSVRFTYIKIQDLMVLWKISKIILKLLFIELNKKETENIKICII